MSGRGAGCVGWGFAMSARRPWLGRAPTNMSAAVMCSSCNLHSAIVYAALRGRPWQPATNKAHAVGYARGATSAAGEHPGRGAWRRSQTSWGQRAGAGVAGDGGGSLP